MRGDLVRKWRLAAKSGWKEVLVQAGKLRIDGKGGLGLDRRQKRHGSDQERAAGGKDAA